jgi:inner membrane protease subunit 1
MNLKTNVKAVKQDIPKASNGSTTSPRQQRSFLALIAVSAIGSFAAGHIFFHYCFEGDFAYGISMLPTLSAFGNYVIINKSYRRGRGVEVGDIVSFKHPVREGEYAVKRVLGLEGDFVLMYTPGANDTMLQVRITDDIVQNSHLDCLR